MHTRRTLLFLLFSFVYFLSAAQEIVLEFHATHASKLEGYRG